MVGDGICGQNPGQASNPADGLVDCDDKGQLCLPQVPSLVTVHLSLCSFQVAILGAADSSVWEPK